MAKVRFFQHNTFGDYMKHSLKNDSSCLHYITSECKLFKGNKLISGTEIVTFVASADALDDLVNCIKVINSLNAGTYDNFELLIDNHGSLQRLGLEHYTGSSQYGGLPVYPFIGIRKSGNVGDYTDYRDFYWLINPIALGELFSNFVDEIAPLDTDVKALENRVKALEEKVNKPTPPSPNLIDPKTLQSLKFGNDYRSVVSSIPTSVLKDNEEIDKSGFSRKGYFILESTGKTIIVYIRDGISLSFLVNTKYVSPSTELYSVSGSQKETVFRDTKLGLGLTQEFKASMIVKSTTYNLFVY